MVTKIYQICLDFIRKMLPKAFQSNDCFYLRFGYKKPLHKLSNGSISRRTARRNRSLPDHSQVSGTGLHGVNEDFEHRATKKLLRAGVCAMVSINSILILHPFWLSNNRPSFDYWLGVPFRLVPHHDVQWHRH